MDEAELPDLHPPVEPDDPPSGRSRPWAAIITGAVGLVAVVALLILYLGAAGERDDERDAVRDLEVDVARANAASEVQASEVDSLTERVASLEADAAAMDDELARAEEEVQQTRSDLAAQEEESDRLDQALDDAQGELRDAQSALANAEATIADLEEAVSDADLMSADVRDFIADLLVGGGEVAVEDSLCLADALVADLGVGVLLDVVTEAANAASGAAGPNAAAAFGVALSGAAEQCGVSVFEFQGDPSLGTYGDDATLDVLWDECEAGRGSACDLLFFEAPVNSEYELFGATCGRRFDILFAPPLCEGVIDD